MQLFSLVCVEMTRKPGDKAKFNPVPVKSSANTQCHDKNIL